MEGGASGQPNSKEFNTAWRKAMSSFFAKAGLDGRRPAVVPAGSRSEAYNLFAERVAKKDLKDFVVLLVDSEVPLLDQNMWAHLAKRPGDKWKKPTKASNADCHLMVVVMETWFLACPAAIKTVLKTDPVKAIPQRNLEDIDKAEVEQLFKRWGYEKGTHATKLIEATEPNAVRDRCPAAAHFLNHLDAIC